MQLSLLKDNELYSCVLPDKQRGQYWVTQRNEQGFEEQVIGVEGIAGRWILKSNRNAYIQDVNKRRVKELAVEAPCFYSIFLRNSKQTVWIYAEPVSDDRKIVNKYVLPDQGKLTIGRSDDCDIRFGNRYVSSKHAELLLSSSGLTVQDLGSANGTFVNGFRVQRKELRPGDIIYVIGLKIIVGQGFIAINNPDGQMNCKPQLLRPYAKQMPLPYDEEEELSREGASSRIFYRSPRFRRDISRAELKIDPPPAPASPDQTPLLLMLGPSVTMGLSAAVMGVFSVQNVLSRGGSLGSATPTIAMSLSMLLGTLLWPILTRKYDRKKRAERESRRQSKYRDYIEQIRQEIADEAVHQSRILHENHVTVDDCVTRIRLRQRNLWERTRGQNDFLTVRLGLGQLPLDAEIHYPEKRFMLDDDNLQEELYKLAEEPKVLQQVPVTLSLAEDWVSGFIGNRSNVVDLVKGIILQLIALHSYDELKLVFLFDNSEQEVWDFVKWLPHSWNNDRSVRLLATTPSEVKELSSCLEKEVAKRETSRSGEEAKESGPYYVLFMMNKSLASKFDVLHTLYKQKKNIGFSVVHLYDELKNVPKESSMVVEFGGGASKLYDKDDITGKHIAFQPDFYLKQNERDLAVSLANTELDSAASSYALPNMLTFLDLFEVGKIEHLNALTRWKENDPTVSLETAIGVDPTGERFKLDLHERFHGPHGLIAGMTGSGKSEFIMTFILSLAVNYHPYEVAFILIDYKGGGMANAFTSLPHLAGTITNLDGAAVKRSLVSIQSELKRRQSIFGETSKRVGISNIDIYKYQKLYREGQVTEPLQHLFIISDEFAELKTQQPEFMEQLVSAARIGRSLGVHLILATQKPSGVVDDQIWSNSKFRICLKVQEKADSMDVIKRPDAAELSVTGRYYVQVGFNELFELGQSAWGGAPYYSSDRTEKPKEEGIKVIDNLGRVVKEVRIDRNKNAIKNPPKQIDEINKYLSGIAEEEGIRIRPLWMEPIPALIYVDELRAKYKATATASGPAVLNPVIGEVDDPANQRQFAMTLPLTQEGNVIVYGAAGNGKTTFVTTAICALMNEHTPAQLNFYLLDFGSETLRSFAKAPHVGDVLLSHETEKVNNLFKLLFGEIDRRKKLFADYGGDFSSYIRATGEDLASIVVVIHNYASFTEIYDDKDEAMAYLTREGLKYGIYFILTASNTGAVRYRLLQNFKQLFVLQLNDPADYSGVLGHVDGVYPSKFKGRGIYKTDTVYEFQIAHAVHDIENTFESIRQWCSDYAQSWKHTGASRIPILPERVDLDYLAERIKLEQEPRLPVGVEKSSLSLAYYPFRQSYISLVLSQNNDNPDFIRGIEEVIAAQGSSEIVALDPERQTVSELEQKVAGLFYTLVARNNEYKDALERGDPPPSFGQLSCLIYSLSGVLSVISGDCQDKLKVLLEKGIAAYRVSVILCDSASKLSSCSYENWFKANVSTSDGIWLGNGIADQYQLKLAKTTSELYQEIGDEFGYVVVKGKPILIKLLSLRASEKEAALVG
ncbi:type VII secretion protein EssC [Cohnella fermenti]|uniref:Type VII secretion protein EssC n=1 Tax=Cohnella fermenti TaxID=2565925 RepID=A0A4S4BHV6_9BACL|nr:type VII secretion protein EssC [Cohnella fermenti]THF73921.1 type VII secretion protein EssC [Cohnella fermenti]